MVFDTNVNTRKDIEKGGYVIYDKVKQMANVEELLNLWKDKHFKLHLFK